MGVVVFLASRGGSSETSTTVRGSISLIGGGGYTTDNPCWGTANALVDFSDMRTGTPIRILDASGTILGTGSLGVGEYSATGGAVWGGEQCKFTFAIPLDSTSSRYQMVIGSRPPFDFTDPNSLELTLGGPR